MEEKASVWGIDNADQENGKRKVNQPGNNQSVNRSFFNWQK